MHSQHRQRGGNRPCRCPAGDSNRRVQLQCGEYGERVRQPRAVRGASQRPQWAPLHRVTPRRRPTMSARGHLGHQPPACGRQQPSEAARSSAVPQIRTTRGHLRATSTTRFVHRIDRSKTVLVKSSTGWPPTNCAPSCHGARGRGLAKITIETTLSGRRRGAGRLTPDSNRRLKPLNTTKSITAGCK